jgi:hypothetical protein
MASWGRTCPCAATVGDWGGRLRRRGSARPGGDGLAPLHRNRSLRSPLARQGRSRSASPAASCIRSRWWQLSTPSRVPRSSKAAATWTSRCVSTPPVMLHAKLVTVIPSLVWVGVTPHQAGRRTRQRWACVRQAPMRSLRPTGRCRVGERARPTNRTKDSPKGRQPEVLSQTWLGTHPHAGQSIHRSGGSPTAASILAAGSVPELKAAGRLVGGEGWIQQSPLPILLLKFGVKFDHVVNQP